MDARTWIYVNPEFWAGLDFPQKVYVIAHENVHGGFWHPQRSNGKEKEIYNIAADAVVYNILDGMIRCPKPMKNFVVSPETISRCTDVDVDEIKTMSVEEVYHLLLKHAVKISVTIDIIAGKGPQRGDVIREGNKVFTSGSPTDIKEAWKSFVAQGYAAQRAAGTAPAGLERMINELLRPKLDPRTLIRQAIRFGLGRTVITDWRAFSRRQPDDLPGVRRLSIPTIWALVDTSGSISEEEMKLELGTIYEFARLTEVRTVSFDTVAYEFVSARKPSDVISKVAGKMKGGGGTMIENALEQTLKKMRPKDMVFVLTDGYIGDIDTPNVQRLLSTIATRCSVSVFASVGAQLSVKGWRTVKLDKR